MNQGTLEQRYNIYCNCADDGTGRDTTTGSRTWLKTFDQWLDGIEGDPCEPRIYDREGFQSWADDPNSEQREDFTEELTPEGIQLVITGAERITAPTETDPQGDLW